MSQEDSAPFETLSCSVLAELQQEKFTPLILGMFFNIYNLKYKSVRGTLETWKSLGPLTLLYLKL